MIVDAFTSAAKSERVDRDFAERDAAHNAFEPPTSSEAEPTLSALAGSDHVLTAERATRKPSSSEAVGCPVGAPKNQCALATVQSASG